MTQSHRPRRTRNPLVLLAVGGVSAIMLILVPTPGAAARPMDPGGQAADFAQLPLLTKASTGLPPAGVVVPAGVDWAWPLRG